MRIEIIVGDWEHDCCGPEIERYQRVEWTYFVDSDGRFFETHHGLQNLDVFAVRGTVVDLELLRPDGSRTRLTRVPSGSALTGNDEHDNGELFELHTDERVDASPPAFVVTVEAD